MRSFAILFTFTALCVMLTICGSSEADTIIVDPVWDGADYSMIHEAAENASAGDTIRVHAGTYVIVEGESGWSATSYPIILSKRINLIGNGSSDTIIDGWKWVDHAHNIHVSAGGCVIDGFTIKASSVHHEFGGVGLYASNTKILNCTFENNNWAINFLGGKKATISNCTFIRNRANIMCYNDGGEDTIIGNTFEDSYVSYTGDESTYANNTGGSISISGDDNLVRDSHFPSSSSGLRIDGSFNHVNNNTMVGNAPVDNWTYGRGLYIATESDDNVIENNTIADNSVGIHIAGSWRHPTHGLLSEPAEDNVIQFNNIFGNDEGIVATTNHDGDTFADDNWWGDASGPSGDGFNGTGDSVSNNTVVDTWLGQAMDLYIPPIARILTPMGKHDNHPIVWNETFHIEGYGTGDIQRYVWRSSIHGEIYNGTDSSFNISTLDPGKHTISLRVQNTDDEWGPWTNRYLFVNMLPVIIKASITPNAVMLGESITLNVTAKDYDGYVREHDYFWVSNISGELTHISLPMDLGNFTRHAPQAGVHTVTVTVRDNWMFMSKPYNLTLIVQQRPVGYLEPGWNLVIVSDSNLTVKCHGRDQDGEVVQWSLASDIDGSLYNGSSLPIHDGPVSKYINWTFEGLTNGVHNITLLVKDNDGFWSYPYTRPLIVHDRPVATIEAIHPDPALEGDYVQFNGSAVDDGTIEVYVWESSLDGEIYNGNKSSFVTFNLSLGDHIITFKVQDDNGAWSHEVNSSISITESPVATIVKISPSPALVNESVSFIGEGRYSNGTIIAYVWNSSLDGVIGRTTNLTLNNLTKGKHRISLTVRATGGIWSVPKKRTLIVHEKPIAVIDSIHPDPGLEGDPAYFAGHGIDDDPILRYVWSSSIDGEFLNGSEDNQTTSMLSFGKHTILFKVLDNNGAWSDKVSMTYWVNAMPIASIITIDPDPAIFGENTTLTGEGSHSNGSIVGSKWTSDLDGLLDRGMEITLANLTKGYHNISFSVVDDKGIWSREKSYILPVFSRPSASIERISPNPAMDGDMITFNGSGTGERPISALQWWLDGDYLSSNPEIKVPDLDAGEYTVRFRVVDNAGVWSDDATETLVINGIPKAVVVSISPDPANAGEVVEFTGGYIDLEDNVTGFRWESNLDGLLSDQQVFNTTGLSNGTHRITLRVMDHHGAWSPTEISNVTVNGLPFARIVSIIPSVANESQKINFTGDSMDFEYDIDEWRWVSNLDGPLSGEMSFTTGELSNGTHVISLSVLDGYNVWSENVTRTVMVNGRPLGRIGSITPEVPNEGDNVTFYGGYLDHEDHVAGFHWESDIDGELSDAAHFSTSNLSAGIHNITFRVMDGNGLWSTNKTRSLEVNGLPTARIINIDPSPSSEGQTVNLTGGYTDLENDVVDFEWVSDIDGTLGDLQNVWIDGLSNGTHNISFRVMDHRGEWSEYVTDTLTVNGIPRASLTVNAPSPTYRRDLIGFIATYSDDGAVVEFKWRSDIDGMLSENPSFETDDLSVGTHTIVLRVRDDMGDWSSDATISLQVLERIYEVEITGLDYPLTARVGDIVTVSATIENTGEFTIDELRLRLTVGESTITVIKTDPVLSGNSTVATFEWTAVQGNHTLVARADVNGELLDMETSSGRLVVKEAKTPTGDGDDEFSPVLMIIIGVIVAEVALIAFVAVRWMNIKK